MEEELSWLQKLSNAITSRFGDDAVDQRAGFVDARKGFGGEGDFCMESGNRNDLFDLQGCSVQRDVTNVFR